MIGRSTGLDIFSSALLEPACAAFLLLTAKQSQAFASCFFTRAVLLHERLIHEHPKGEALPVTERASVGSEELVERLLRGGPGGVRAMYL